MTWLVTGGAGYIGAHVVRAMREDGIDVVVLDDLSTGDASRIGDVPLVRASLLDRQAVDTTLADHDVSGVVHIAAKKQVGESVEDPYYYFRQNVVGQLTLMEAMRDAGVRRFVFSSSASTYGSPETALVEEKAHLEPESPYGQTKVAGEWLAVDAENHQRDLLGDVDQVVVWTEFGRRQIAECGYDGPIEVVPLGADLDEFYPVDIFPTLDDTENRDPGPRIVSLIRHLAAAREEVERLQSDLFLIREARVDYGAALHRREHGGVAADRFLHAVFAVLDESKAAAVSQQGETP